MEEETEGDGVGRARVARSHVFNHFARSQWHGTGRWIVCTGGGGGRGARRVRGGWKGGGWFREMFPAVFDPPRLASSISPLELCLSVSGC